MAQSRQAKYLRGRSLLTLRGLAAGAGIEVSDTGTAWRVWRLADGVTLTIQSRYQVAYAFIDGVREGRKLAATSAETHIGPVPTTVRMAGDG